MTRPETWKKIRSIVEQYEDGAITYSEAINAIAKVVDEVVGTLQTDYIKSVLETRSMSEG